MWCCQMSCFVQPETKRYSIFSHIRQKTSISEKQELVKFDLCLINDWNHQPIIKIVMMNLMWLIVWAQFQCSTASRLETNICMFLLGWLERLSPKLSSMTCNAVGPLGAGHWYTPLFLSCDISGPPGNKQRTSIFLLSLRCPWPGCPLAFLGPLLIKAPLRLLSGSGADSDLMICVRLKNLPFLCD